MEAVRENIESVITCQLITLILFLTNPSIITLGGSTFFGWSGARGESHWDKVPKSMGTMFRNSTIVCAFIAL